MMTEQTSDPFLARRGDRILPLTRAVSWLVIPFLLAAFLILYVDGRHTAAWFAWEIPSRLTTGFMGAGYLGGAYFFLRVALGSRQNYIHLGAGYTPDTSYLARMPALRWHNVHAGFLPVMIFTAAILLTTVIHRSSFITTNWPFWVWLAIYVITPPLLAVIWWLNRREDPRRPQAGDRLVPPWLRGVMGLAGGLLLLLSLAAFVRPDLIMPIWPWTLSPLTARVLASWHILLGAGALGLAADNRWSAWPVPMQSICLWMGLVLLALLLHTAELGAAGLANWYTLFAAAGLAGMGAIALVMRGQRPLP